MELNRQQCEQVHGGTGAEIIEAISIAVQVYEGGALIIAATQSPSTQIYADLGARIGEYVFDVTHPDPLGQMVYYPSDF